MKRRVSRRALLAGAGLGLVASGLEVLSLRGRFDHRRSPGAAARERFAASLEKSEHDRPGLVHVGHSTHLLSIAGLRLLTDPWFYDPAFGALSHEVIPAVRPSEIGRLDAILVTHDHADHADLRAIDELDKRAAVIAPTADLAARIKARGYSDVTVLAPWEERKLGEVTVAAVPGLHDIYEIGFVVRSGSTSVYFAGDTRLHPDLPAIAERFAPKVAILPVDGTRLVGGALHVMTPEDATAAAKTLRSSLVIPSHAEATFSDPIVEVALASTVPRARHRFAELIARVLPAVACRVPEAGELVAL